MLRRAARMLSRRKILLMRPRILLSPDACVGYIVRRSPDFLNQESVLDRNGGSKFVPFHIAGPLVRLFWFTHTVARLTGFFMFFFRLTRPLGDARGQSVSSFGVRHLTAHFHSRQNAGETASGPEPAAAKSLQRCGTCQQTATPMGFAADRSAGAFSAQPPDVAETAESSQMAIALLGETCVRGTCSRAAYRPAVMPT